MKTCSRCRIEFNEDDFPRRSTGKPGAFCRQCKRDYDREYWARTKGVRNTHKIANSNRNKARNKRLLLAYLTTHPCVDCREADLDVLDFDHVRGTKVATVTRMAAACSSIGALQREISKCEIRCANCHRRRHAKLRRA